MELLDEELRGRTIVSADGWVVGQIDAICVDCETWRATSLSVKLDKMIADQMGADRGVCHPGTLRMPVYMVHSVGDTVVLSVSFEQLQSVPSASRRPGRPASKSESESRCDERNQLRIAEVSW